MTNRPHISVIIPLYNKEETIKDTIDSVLNQKFSDFELVIINDGSTDSSKEKINGIKDSRIRIIDKENGGVSSARNLGVSQSSGEWVVFLDADDLLLPEALLHFNELIISHPEISFFSCNFFTSKTETNQVFSNHYYQGILNNSFYGWLIGRFMPRAGASIYKKELFQRNPFQENLHRYEDAEVLFKIMRDTKIFCSSKPVMIYNLDSLDASKRRKNISDDFLGHITLKGKSFWEKVVLYDLFRQAVFLYPIEAKILYKTLYYRYDYYLIRLLIKIIQKITRIRYRKPNNI